MKISSLWMQLPAIIIVCMVVAACGTDGPSGKARLVEVWRGGDDELTVRLKDAVESAFKTSPDFVLSTAKKPGTLLVKIPSRVRFKQVDMRKQVLYDAVFSSTDGRNVGTSSGSCWDDALMICASKIVKDAKIAARKIH
jgi:hypothetical protein